MRGQRFSTADRKKLAFLSLLLMATGLSAKRAAFYLNAPGSTLRQWRKEFYGPSHRLTRSTCFLGDQLINSLKNDLGEQAPQFPHTLL